MYSRQVRRLLLQLPNRGELEQWTHMARLENPVCGDVTQFQLRVKADVIVACRFQGQGCPAALAAAAAVTELVQGNPVAAAWRLSASQLNEYLGGLPEAKTHGVILAVETLQEALAFSG